MWCPVLPIRRSASASASLSLPLVCLFAPTQPIVQLAQALITPQARGTEPKWSDRRDEGEKASDPR